MFKLQSFQYIVHKSLFHFFPIVEYNQYINFQQNRNYNISNSLYSHLFPIISPGVFSVDVCKLYTL